MGWTKLKEIAPVITEENVDEKLFTENFVDPDDPIIYFATLIEIGDYQEEGFSVTRETFRLRIKVALIGSLATDDFNPKNVGNLNVLITVNTMQSDVDALLAPPSADFLKGARWFDKTANKVKEHSGSTIDLSLSTVTYTPGLTGAVVKKTGAFSAFSFKVNDKIELGREDTTPEFVPGVYDVIEKISDDEIRLNGNPAGNVVATIKVLPQWSKTLYTVPADDASIGFKKAIILRMR